MLYMHVLFGSLPAAHTLYYSFHSWILEASCMKKKIKVDEGK